MEILRILGLQSNQFKKTYAAYDNGKLSLEQAAEELGAYLFDYHLNQARAADLRENADLMPILRYELLGVENHDSRSIAEMTSSGLAYFSGGTTACVVAAECSPEVGVGMSHRNTVTLDF